MATNRGNKPNTQKQITKFSWNSRGENKEMVSEGDPKASPSAPVAKTLTLEDVMEAIAGVRTSLEMRIDSVNIEVTLEQTCERWTTRSKFSRLKQQQS